MAFTRSEALDKIQNLYSAWYDLQQEEGSEPLVLSGSFHERAASYAISKKAEMWSFERHEYVYFFSVEHLTTEIYQECLACARELGEPLVNPVKNHMSTNIVMVVVCDVADEDAIRELKRCHIRKSFQFSLRGWMEVQTAAVELGKDSIVTNAAGSNTAKFLKSALYPRAKKGLRKILR